MYSLLRDQFVWADGSSNVCANVYAAKLLMNKILILQNIIQVSMIYLKVA